MMMLVSLMMVLSGCTITLGAIGLASDKGKASSTYTVSNYELGMIKKGYLVEVYAIDGRIFRGNFLGTETNYSIDLIRLRINDDIIRIRSSNIAKIQVLAEKKEKGWWIAFGAVLDGLLIWGIRQGFLE